MITFSTTHQLSDLKQLWVMIWMGLWEALTTENQNKLLLYKCKLTKSY